DFAWVEFSAAQAPLQKATVRFGAAWFSVPLHPRKYFLALPSLEPSRRPNPPIAVLPLKPEFHICPVRANLSPRNSSPPIAPTPPGPPAPALPTARPVPPEPPAATASSLLPSPLSGSKNWTKSTVCAPG